MKHTHVLNWPLMTPPVTSIDIRPLSIDSKVMIEGKQLSPEDNETALILASISINAEQLEQLKTPDYNSVKQQVNRYLDHEAFTDELTCSPGALLLPVTGDNGATIEQYSLSIPTVKATRIMNGFTNVFEQSAFIAGQCTGWSMTEIKQLSLPDWSWLMKRINDFLVKTADCFPCETPKP